MNSKAKILIRKIKILSSIVLLMAIVLAIFLTAFADYYPHSRISVRFSFKGDVASTLAEECINNTFPKNDKELDVIMNSIVMEWSSSTGRNFSDIKEHSLRRINDGTIQLKVSLSKDIYWSAPWKNWMGAIPKGSYAIFEGRCIIYEGLKINMVSTTIPSEFLRNRNL